MQSQTGNQFFRLGYQLVKGRVGILGLAELEHLHLVELVAPHHAPLVGTVGTGLPAEAGGVGKQLFGQVSFGQNFIPVDRAEGGFRGGQHIVHPVVGGVGDLVDLVGELGELTGGLAAGVLQHVRGQDELVAVGDVGVDEVVQQRPLKSCAHAGVHPVAGACQLHATLIVNESQILAQVHMVLRLKVKGMLLPNVSQGLVVLLAAGQQVGVGHIGKAQHGGTEFGIEHLQLFGVVGDFLVQTDGLGFVGFDLGIEGGGVLAALLHALLLAEQLAVFLCQLVLLGGSGLGGGLQAPNLHVKFQNPVNGSIAVNFFGFHARLDGIGIFLDTFDIQHCVLPLLRIVIFPVSTVRPAASASPLHRRIPAQSGPCACR